METTITIEPMSITHISENPQKRYSINYSTTIPLEIPVQDAWEIVKDIIRICFPDDNVRLEAITEDLAQDRYCFSVSGKVEPKALDITVDLTGEEGFL